MPPEDPSPGFLPKSGNYQDLLSYKKSEIIYDLTFRFCEKHLKRGDRTIDQMVQAARSGKQNIAEGCKAAVTSTETEIKLTNVVRTRSSTRASCKPTTYPPILCTGTIHCSLALLLPSFSPHAWLRPPHCHEVLR